LVSPAHAPLQAIPIWVLISASVFSPLEDIHIFIVQIADQEYIATTKGAIARTRKFAVSVVLLALLTLQSYAQSLPESPRQKAEEARKKADEKATDEAYKALIKRMPDHPWCAPSRTHIKVSA
jgi:hypothetical protein